MLRQIRIPVKSFKGECDSLCSECSTARGVVARTSTADNSGVLYGQIVPRAVDGASKWIEGCQCYINFEYDDVQLAPNIVLKPCDICLACGCLVDLIDRQGFSITDLFGNSAFISPFEVIQFQGVNLATVTIADGDPNTIIVDVPCSEVRTCFSAVDTATVDYTYNPATGLHFADVKISAAAGNDILVNPDGLYVNFADKCDEIRTCFSAVDTATVDYTYNPATGVHQADVKISAAPGNDILVNPDGLYVDFSANCPEIRTCFTAIPKPTAVTQYNPATGVFETDAVVSPQPGNILVALGDGLFVPTPAAPVSDSLVDNGDRTFTHTAVNGIAQNFCQGIQTIVTPNTCEGIGANYAIKSASLNGCVLNLNGAYEHTTNTAAGQVTEPPLVPAPGGGPINLLTQNILINNPSPCREFRALFLAIVSIEFELPPGTEIVLSYTSGPTRQGPSPSHYRGTETHTYQAYYVVPPGGSAIATGLLDLTTISGSCNVWGRGINIGFIGSTV
jgi:hypothetical protein